MSWQSQLTAILAASLVRPLALAAAAWLILRVLRVRHPASRHAVWTAVLIGMLLLPIVSVTTPHWNVPVPPGKHDGTAQALASGPAAGTETERLGSPTRETARTSQAAAKAGLEFPSVKTLVLWCYLAGLLAMLAYRAAGVAMVWRVLSRSTPLRGRRLRESGDVMAPVAIGMLRPAVILPAGWRSWNANTRRAVLVHEFAHLRRHDLLVSWLARAAKCLFWFHPLAWWLSRKISDLAELACDAAVLERTHDPVGYSKILLDFADAVNSAGHRAALPGLAMAAVSHMGRRIDQSFELAGEKPRRLVRARLLLTLTGLPVMCLAATVGLNEQSANSQGSAAPSASHPALRPLAQTVPATPPGSSVVAPQLPAQSGRGAKPESHAAYLRGLGNVTASYTVTVRSQVDGPLMNVNFKEGELVQAGQTLASIDPTSYEVQLSEARGQLAADEAMMKNADLYLARYQKLVAENAIPKEQIDTPAATIVQLQGKIKADQAIVARAELQLSRTKIISPLTGVAGLRLVDPGNMVHAADAAGIVIITQLKPISVLFTLPEDNLPQVRARLKETANPMVEAWNRDYSARIATGRLTAIDNQIDMTTGTIKLKAVFDNTDGALVPGQLVNVRLFLSGQ